MMPAARFRCLALHAECLDVPKVWQRTSRVLQALERHGGRATLFVHPLQAIESGVDLGPKIRELLDRGHEIAQHTHFYAPRTERHRGKPPTLATPHNIRRCLDRDLAYLLAAGADPKGFTSGGWAIEPEVGGWLDEHRFAYDCSYRSFGLRYVSAAAEAGGGRLRPERVGSLLQIPTTLPLREAVLGIVTRQRRRLRAGPVPYELVYVHDYDLASTIRSRAALAVIGSWSRGAGRWTTAGDLAVEIGAEIV